ncbi:efflux transporter outer membrane subunit [Chitinibacter tainanensis]|uniref:efflux transporter outer membrane subunit n=1 Tax=Chitinibacter tainanensis TaxID=230667 RepID=UPI002352818F|nr:efflux transporter outer membrane subunit [Chitinibacter tainanensis]
MQAKFNKVYKAIPVGVLLALLSLLGACASPAWQAPAVNTPANWQSATASQISQPAADAAFWASFADPQLLQLQTEALSRNADLAQAALRWRKAGLLVTQNQQAQLPNVSLSANSGAAWQLDPARHTSDSFGLSLSASWELDLWGKLADQTRAASWRTTASASDWQALRQSVRSEVAQAYWAIAREQAALTLAQADLARAEALQARVNTRYQAGYLSGLDVAQARDSVAQQRSRVLEAQLALDKSRWALATLLDQPPATYAQLQAALPSELPNVPAGLPAEVLDRRPDLASARANLQAAFADEAVSRKSWYPTLSLTGSLGSNSQELSNLLVNPVAQLGAGLVLPFINWHKRDTALKISALDYEAAVIGYRQKLYQALQEVEIALASRSQLQANQPLLATQLRDAEQAERQTELRYRAGVIQFDSVLSAQARRQQVQNQLLQQRYQLAVASSNVYRALGGAPDGATPDNLAQATR